MSAISEVQAVLEPYAQQALESVPRISTATMIITIIALCIPPIAALILFEKEAARLRADEPKGCRKLGINVTSNLSNEFDPRFAEGFPASSEETSADWWRIKSLWVYPVKSCKGVELGRTSCLRTGMEYDRQFTFAQLKSPAESGDAAGGENASHKWHFITQRQYPKLSNVRTEIYAPDQSVDSYVAHEKEVESGGVIMVYFPYQAPGWKGYVAKFGAKLKGTFPEKSFKIPFDPTAAQIEKAGYSREPMTIWKETVNALNMEIEIPDELRYYLGMSNKLGLFRIDNEKLREVHRNAPKASEIGYQPVTGFQDAYPLHVINLASVRAVEKDMPQGSPRLSAARFRANIIVTGPEAYDEEEWKKIKIGYYEFHVAARTARCKMPNIDQETGEKHPTEPDHTLRTFRNVDTGAGPNVGYLGMQMVPVDETSQYKVGDEIVVTERGQHTYIPQ